MEWSLFLDSEETIHSAEINDTSYEPPSCFSLGKKNKKYIFFEKKIKMADSKKAPMHEIFMKKYWELVELENDIFWFVVIGVFKKKLFSEWKSVWLSYDVSFISALWMVSSDLLKRLHPTYTHDCSVKL